MIVGVLLRVSARIVVVITHAAGGTRGTEQAALVPIEATIAARALGAGSLRRAGSAIGKNLLAARPRTVVTRIAVRIATRAGRETLSVAGVAVDSTAGVGQYIVGEIVVVILAVAAVDPARVDLSEAISADTRIAAQV